MALSTRIGSVLRGTYAGPREAGRNEGQAPGHAIAGRGLASQNLRVNQAYNSVLNAAKACVQSQPPYHLAVLNQLHHAMEQYVTAFDTARPDAGQAGSVQGDMAAALANAAGRLPVKPSHHGASLRTLLNNLLERLEPYADADVAPGMNAFPELHAAASAYLKALGAQPLQVSSVMARLLPQARRKTRTPEDIHEQALQAVRPDLADGGRERTITAPASRTGRLDIPPPGYNPDPNAVIGRCELPADLDQRIGRYLHKLNKEQGLSTMQDPSFSTVIGELKALLGSESISPAERGEILYRLACRLPSSPRGTGVSNSEQVARLFLRFLAPDALPPTYSQSHIALRAQVGDANFNPEALVLNASKVLIIEALIRKLGHSRFAGMTACVILQNALLSMRGKDAVMHTKLLALAAKAIQDIQERRQDTLRFHNWFSVIVNELDSFEQHIRTGPNEGLSLQVRRQIYSCMQELREVEFRMRGLNFPGMPDNWNGRLTTLNSYRLLRRHADLDYENELPADEPVADIPINDLITDPVAPPPYPHAVAQGTTPVAGAA